MKSKRVEVRMLVILTGEEAAVRGEVALLKAHKPHSYRVDMECVEALEEGRDGD